MIEQILQDVADMLLANSYFEDVPVVVTKKGNLLSEIEQTLAKNKLLVAPVVTRARMTNANSETVYFSEIMLTVGVFESVLVNQSASGTGKTSWTVAEKVAALLHGARAQSLSAGFTLTGLEPEADKQLSIVNCNFETEGGLATVLIQAAAPVIAVANGFATMTCATPGAAIFYRLDGKHPSPRAGTLYTHPVAVVSANRLRARAWLAGYLTSEISSYNA